MRKALLVSCCCVFILAPNESSVAQGVADCIIVAPLHASFQEQLAAKEVRRYVYVRTGQLFDIKNAEEVPAGAKNAIVLGTNQSALLRNVDRSLTRKLSELKPEQYLLRTIVARGRTLLIIAGGDGAGTLYGAYRFAERLGMAFGLDGDVIPDGRIPFALPALDESSAPLFKLRGIQPFHDFPEGPDWWDTDDYLAIIGQLPKMGMNFFGLHTYPEGAPNAEPTVWIGREGEFNRDGTVRKAYPASYQNTLRGNWGYRPKKTSDYSHGAAMLFDRDEYGSEIMRGHTPEPKTDTQSIQVFNRTGVMLQKAFSAARRLGVKTCVGTETFLTIPKLVKERLKADGEDPDDTTTVRALYNGIFRRIAATYPIDYYWFWTPEGWTWQVVEDEQIRKTMTDLSIAIEEAKVIGVPFQLATCGWVFGPPSDRSLFDRELPKNISFSCINREVGKSPVDVAFAQVSGRSCWAIPWIEDDPSLLAPQLWAGRVRKDAADALAYGCDGLLGIHWRTRILSPNFLALARAGWDQSSWNKEPLPFRERRGAVNGTHEAVDDSVVIANAADPAIYRTIRRRVSSYNLAVPNGTYNVTLQFCEPVPPIRHLFDVSIQGTKVLDGLDIALRVGFCSALDTMFQNVSVTEEVLKIDFAGRVGVPSVAGIVIEAPGYSRRINCGGPAYKNYEADEPSTSRALPTDDLYRDWAMHQFGAEVAEDAARIFASLDSRLPEPATWYTGPGNVIPNDSTWESVQMKYLFVDSLQQLQGRVRGKANLERFEYWLNTFLHMKGMARLGCLWGAYGRAIDRVFQHRPIPSFELFPPSASGHGLLGEYFNDTTRSGPPVMTRVDSTVDFDWSGRSPGGTVRRDSFSVRWTGTLVARQSGPGRLGVSGPAGMRLWDGVRLWVDGKLIVDDWSSHAWKTPLVDLVFEAGKKYDLKLEYFHNGGDSRVQLVGAVVDPDSMRRFVTSVLLPVRKEMIQTIRTTYGHLLATVTNSAELGTIMNWEQHNFPALFEEPGAEAEKHLGHPLSDDLKLARVYIGSPRVIVPTVKTMTGRRTPLRLKVLILSNTPPTEATVKWRAVGAGKYEQLALKHISRGVYEATLPVKDADLEYYVAVKSGSQEILYPASAPEIGQTVVVMDMEKAGV